MTRHILLFGALGFLSCLLAAAIKGLPYPLVHDEYSYLLMGEMFSQLRTSYPSPDLPVFFEAFYVSMKPAMFSKYFPAQGVMLAIGFLLGHPIIGIWLNMGLVMAAAYWMFAQYFDAQWSKIGTMLLILCFGFFHYFSQSFYGGGAAMLGGILIIGAIGSLNKDLSCYRTPLLFIVGTLLLAHSRPYEGLIFLMVPGCFYLNTIIRHYRKLRLKYTLTTLTAGALVVTASILTYNHSVTGNVVDFPYTNYEATYSNSGGIGGFLNVPTSSKVSSGSTESPHSTALINNSFAARIQALDREYLTPRSELSPLQYWSAVFSSYFIENAQLAFPLLIIAALSRLKRPPLSLFLWSTLLVGSLGIISTVPFWFHYAAPLIGVAAVLSVSGLKSLTHYLKSKNILRTRYVVEAALLLLFINFCFSGLVRRSRENADSYLQSQVGKQLVFVSYDETVSAHDEWVYNSPDFETTSVLWARDLGEVKNKKLTSLFPDHTPWSLTVKHNFAEIKLLSQPQKTYRAPYPDSLKIAAVRKLQQLTSPNTD